MNSYKPYEFFSQEPDIEMRIKSMFFMPFQVRMLEGGHDLEEDLDDCVILSSN